MSALGLRARTHAVGPNTRRSRPELLLHAGAVYLGAVVPLPQYVGGRMVAGFGLQLLVGIALAFAGWARASGSPATASYMVPALLLGSWAMVSAIAVWVGATVYVSFTFLVWFVFIIPGLGFLLRGKSYRSAILFGLASGIVVYGTTVLFRKATGRSALDAQSDNVLVGLILNENRNLIAMTILAVMPYLLLKVWPERFHRTRWALAGLGAATIVLGGGRSGLLGLAAFVLLTGLLQEGIGPRVRRTLAAAMVGVTFLIVSQALGGDVARATDRIVNYFGDEKDNSDKARDLVTRKAWNLALDYPAFGVGFQNSAVAYHPVLEEAENSEVRWNAGRLTPHNTYAQVLAEFGFPALFLFVLLLGSLFIRCVRAVEDIGVRCAGAGFGAILLMITFDHVLGMVLYLPIALVLGALGARTAPPDDAGVAPRSVSPPLGRPATAR